MKFYNTLWHDELLSMLSNSSRHSSILVPSINCQASVPSSHHILSTTETQLLPTYSTPCLAHALAGLLEKQLLGGLVQRDEGRAQYAVQLSPTLRSATSLMSTEKRGSLAAALQKQSGCTLGLPAPNKARASQYSMLHTGTVAGTPACLYAPHSLNAAQRSFTYQSMVATTDCPSGKVLGSRSRAFFSPAARPRECAAVIIAPTYASSCCTVTLPAGLTLSYASTLSMSTPSHPADTAPSSRADMNPTSARRTSLVLSSSHNSSWKGGASFPAYSLPPPPTDVSSFFQSSPRSLSAATRPGSYVPMLK
mmetsp:Transcript_30654/g.78283  ORF Transcript_30654/g.78283 Transcript_30654/m.78283 type:complete len:308 (+) Transcript_30654:187-1110(+)